MVTTGVKSSSFWQVPNNETDATRWESNRLIDYLFDAADYVESETGVLLRKISEHRSSIE